MRVLSHATAALCLVAVTAASAAAQSPSFSFDQRRQPAPQRGASSSRSRSRVGVRIFGGVDIASIASPRTFKAEFGSSTITGFAVGADITDIWRHAFLRVSLSHLSATGTRAVGNISTGIPTTVSLTPVEIGGGWRFVSKRPNPAAVPYAGLGIVAQSFSQTSTGAIAGEDASATYKGVFVMGGVDIRVTKMLSVAAEADYRSVKTVPLVGSELDAQGENNLGGMAFRILFAIRK